MAVETLPSTFNRRITVKRAITVADDAFGTGNNGFTERFVTWANVQQLSDSRKAYYGLDLFTMYWQIVLRYTADRKFTTADLIDYEDLTLSVVGTDTILQNYKNFSVLMCVNSGLK
jgi:head-tail adaptor